MYHHIKRKHQGLAPKGTPVIKLGRPETKPKLPKRRVCGCGKTFKYRQGIHRHIKDKHGGEQPDAFEFKEKLKMTEVKREKLLEDVLKKEEQISDFKDYLKKFEYEIKSLRVALRPLKRKQRSYEVKNLI